MGSELRCSNGTGKKLWCQGMHHPRAASCVQLHPKQLQLLQQGQETQTRPRHQVHAWPPLASRQPAPHVTCRYTSCSCLRLWLQSAPVFAAH